MDNPFAFSRDGMSHRTELYVQTHEVVTVTDDEPAPYSFGKPRQLENKYQKANRLIATCEKQLANLMRTYRAHIVMGSKRGDRDIALFHGQIFHINKRIAHLLTVR